MSDSHKHIFWSAVERFSVQGCQFVLSLVIARLVTPADFGLIAMLGIFLSVAQVFVDSGFGSALIQKQDRKAVDYSTVFLSNMLIAITLYLILFFLAPYIANFYRTPELEILTRILGLNLILQALFLIQKTIYRIQLNFKTSAIISLLAMILSGTLGIMLAYKGYGVWALVYQSLSYNIFLAILFWVTSKWSPSCEFSFRSFKSLFSFGSKLLLSYLLHTIFLNLYSLVIGKFYNPSDVGYYNRASTISQYAPTNLMAIITNVAYPLQCSHQNDKEWILSTFPSLIRMSCYIVFPIMILLAVISKPLVLIILSDKWISTAPFISVLALAYMWTSIGMLNSNLINSSGRSDLYLRAEVIKKIVAIAILLITLPFGLLWLCIGLLIYNLIDIGIIIYFTRKIFNIGYIIQGKAFLPVLFISLFSGVVAYSLILLDRDVFVTLIIQIISFGAIYILLSKVIGLKELKTLRSYIKI